MSAMENEALSDGEIADLARRLAKILDDEEGRGMATWVMIRNRLASELHEALGAKLAVPVTRAETSTRA
jgi:hypothetical protein